MLSNRVIFNKCWRDLCRHLFSLTLTFYSQSTDSILRDARISPTWLTTTPFPSTYYGQIYYQLLKLYNWSNLFVVTDTGTFIVYRSVSQRAVSPLASLGLYADQYSYSLKSGTFNVPVILQRFARVSRGKSISRIN
jgi:hypothetical protein